jgi:hypothetical protein
LFEDDEEHFHLKDILNFFDLEREGEEKREHMQPTFVTATYLIAKHTEDAFSFDSFFSVASIPTTQNTTTHKDTKPGLRPRSFRKAA